MNAPGNDDPVFEFFSDSVYQYNIGLAIASTVLGAMVECVVFGELNLLLVLAGVIGLAFLGRRMWLRIWRWVFRRTPLLTIGPEGITNHERSDDSIPWHEILSVSYDSKVFAWGEDAASDFLIVARRRPDGGSKDDVIELNRFGSSPEEIIDAVNDYAERIPQTALQYRSAKDIRYYLEWAFAHAFTFAFSIIAVASLSIGVYALFTPDALGAFTIFTFIASLCGFVAYRTFREIFRLRKRRRGIPVA